MRSQVLYQAAQLHCASLSGAASKNMQHTAGNRSVIDLAAPLSSHFRSGRSIQSQCAMDTLCRTACLTPSLSSSSGIVQLKMDMLLGLARLRLLV